MKSKFDLSDFRVVKIPNSWPRKLYKLYGADWPEMAREELKKWIDSLEVDNAKGGTEQEAATVGA